MHWNSSVTRALEGGRLNFIIVPWLKMLQCRFSMGILLTIPWILWLGRLSLETSIILRKLLLILSSRTVKVNGWGRLAWHSSFLMDSMGLDLSIPAVGFRDSYSLQILMEEWLIILGSQQIRINLLSYLTISSMRTANQQTSLWWFLQNHQTSSTFWEGKWNETTESLWWSQDRKPVNIQLFSFKALFLSFYFWGFVRGFEVWASSRAHQFIRLWKLWCDYLLFWEVCLWYRSSY